MSAQSRRQRGNQAVNWLAAHYQERGWPYAEAVGSGRNGSDLTGMPGLACEVKATTDMRLESWLEQAEGRPGLAYAVWRPPGYGRATLRAWPAVMRAMTLEALLDSSGLAMITEWVGVRADHVDVALGIRQAHLSYPRPVVLCYQGRGALESNRDRWPAVLTVDSHTDVLAAAGYGGEATTDPAVACRKRNTEG